MIQQITTQAAKPFRSYIWELHAIVTSTIFCWLPHPILIQFGRELYKVWVPGSEDNWGPSWRMSDTVLLLKNEWIYIYMYGSTHGCNLVLLICHYANITLYLSLHKSCNILFFFITMLVIQFLAFQLLAFSYKRQSHCVSQHFIVVTKIPDTNHLKISFGMWFQPMVSWLCCFGLEVS